jgi:hypothetical protein
MTNSINSQVNANLGSYTSLEELAGNVGNRIWKEEQDLLDVISAGKDAKFEVGGKTYTGEAALTAAQASYQRIQRVWSTIQSIMQRSHQMMMEAIRNIGRT